MNLSHRSTRNNSCLAHATAGGSLLVLITMLFLAVGITAAPEAPPTPSQPVTDSYHDTSVTDPYRWLEEWENPEVRTWSDAQNEYTRSYLDALPDRESVARRLQELMKEESQEYYSLKYSGGQLFAMKHQPPHEQPFLVAISSPEDLSTEQVILDLTALDPEATTAVDFYVPSHDGKMVAVSLSEQGSERGDVYVYVTATGERLDDMVPYVNGPTAGGDVAWRIDNSGFYYTRYPRKGERPDEDLSFFQQVYYHQLGTATEEDTYAIGREFPRIAEIELDVSDDGTLVLATVSNGDGGEYAHYLKDSSGAWTQLTRFEDLIPTVKFGRDNSLYFLSNNGTPRGRLLYLPPGQTDITRAVVVVVQSDVTIKEFLPTESKLYLVDLAGGPRRMRLMDLKSGQQKSLPVEPISYIGNLTSIGGDRILVRSQSYIEPPAWYRYDPVSDDLVRTSMYKTSPAEFDDVEVVREFATSKDGTRVPVNIIRPKGIELDGQNPTILYGYGGYGISLSPSFDAARRLWFDQGGVYAVANIRGGGEFGEAWHLAGNLTNKQNVFDDFNACAEYLIEAGYTSPKKLCIRGGSNGGLLMGAALTQRPDLYAAVVSRAGIYDMLRVELDPNGVFNITEFGTVRDPEQFEALLAYSPYHNVAENTAYPAVLFTTGEHDGRVNPYQSRKMTAALQSATTTERPILLRTSSTTGHGRGTALSEKIATRADVYSFILDQLEIRYRYDR